MELPLTDNFDKSQVQNTIPNECENLPFSESISRLMDLPLTDDFAENGNQIAMENTEYNDMESKQDTFDCPEKLSLSQETNVDKAVDYNSMHFENEINSLSRD